MENDPFIDELPLKIVIFYSKLLVRLPGRVIHPIMGWTSVKNPKDLN
jgi:hypothetical protein